MRVFAAAYDENVRADRTVFGKRFENAEVTLALQAGHFMTTELAAVIAVLAS